MLANNPNRVLFNPLWPEAKWDISGAFAHDKERLGLYDYFNTFYGIKLFDLVHGSPLFPWNSGRVLPEFKRTPLEINLCGKAYAQRNIPIDFTFTNTILTKQHMEDFFGNTMLEFARQFNPTNKNAIILASDCLYEHVKKNFPELKLVSSILKVATEKGKGKLDYYLSLAEKYDKVMIHPDDTRNFDLLEKLEDKNKYELIVNEYCITNCPLRNSHYKHLSQCALEQNKDSTTFDKKIQKNGCQSYSHQLLSKDKHVVALTDEEIKRVYDMGFRLFKMQGRGMGNGAGVILDIFRLILRQDSPGENYMQQIKSQCLDSLILSTYPL